MLVVHDVVAGLEVVEELLGVALAGPGLAVAAPAAGEVGLGQQRQLHPGQDAAPLEGLDDDLALDPGVVEQLAEAGGRTLAVGGDHDAVAVGLQVAQLPAAPVLVAERDLEA